MVLALKLMLVKLVDSLRNVQQNINVLSLVERQIQNYSEHLNLEMYNLNENFEVLHSETKGHMLNYLESLI